MANPRAILLGCLMAASGLVHGLVAAPSSEAQPPVAVAVPATAVDRDKRLGVGDQVTLQILEDKEEPAMKMITATGDLEVSPIGRVHVAGKTCTEAQALIKKKLEEEYYHKATVRLNLDQISPQRATAVVLGKVLVSGEVKAPGEVELAPGQTLTAGSAVLKAGGFTQWSNKSTVQIIRGGRSGNQTQTIDLKKVLEGGQVDLDVEVRDGDRIIVKRRAIVL